MTKKKKKGKQTVMLGGFHWCILLRSINICTMLQSIHLIPSYIIVTFITFCDKGWVTLDLWVYSLLVVLVHLWQSLFLLKQFIHYSRLHTLLIETLRLGLWLALVLSLVLLELLIFNWIYLKIIELLLVAGLLLILVIKLLWLLPSFLFALGLLDFVLIDDLQLTFDKPF